MSNLGNMYCREDYKQAIKYVRKAPRDAYQFRKADLETMCKGNADLTADGLLADKSLLDSIPIRPELLHKLLDMML